LTPEEFQKEIRSDARKHFYIVKGPEPLGLEGCLAAAMEALDESQRAFNLHVFRLGDDMIDDAIRAASTSSFFSSSAKIVVVKNPDGLKRVGSTVTDALLSWAKEPRPDATIVLFQEKPDMRTRYVDAAKKMGTLVDCAAPSKKEMLPWINKAFKSRGLKVAPDAARLMLDRAGDSLSLLMNAAEKLSVWPGPSRPVSVVDVREQVPLVPSSVLYELGEPVGERRPQGAVPVLLDLIEGGQAFAVVSALSGHMRKLLAIKAAVASAGAEGRPVDTMCAELGIKTGFYLDKMKAQAARWTLRELRAAVSKAEQAYRRLVTTSVPPEIILEELAVGLSLPAPPRPGSQPYQVPGR
jgi:DNA polymerase-3 subunit delta